MTSEREESEARNQFNTDVEILRDETLDGGDRGRASPVHVALAESAKQLELYAFLFRRTAVKKSDIRDIEALRYLTAYRAAKTHHFPNPEFRDKINGLVDQIHHYLVTYRQDELVQAQELARIIGNPRAKPRDTDGVSR